MPSLRHKLTSHHEYGFATAICMICGPTKIYKNKDFWRCEGARPTARNGSKIDVRRREELMDVRCRICKSLEHLILDHCHITGEVRGTLCHHCNVGLGHFKDNPEFLRRAAEYLER